MEFGFLICESLKALKPLDVGLCYNTVIICSEMGPQFLHNHILFEKIMTECYIFVCSAPITETWKCLMSFMQNVCVI